MFYTDLSIGRNHSLLEDWKSAGPIYRHVVIQTSSGILFEMQNSFLIEQHKNDGKILRVAKFCSPIPSPRKGVCVT